MRPLVRLAVPLARGRRQLRRLRWATTNGGSADGGNGAGLRQRRCGRGSCSSSRAARAATAPASVPTSRAFTAPRSSSRTARPSSPTTPTCERSITDPGAQRVAGYDVRMPTAERERRGARPARCLHPRASDPTRERTLRHEPSTSRSSIAVVVAIARWPLGGCGGDDDGSRCIRSARRRITGSANGSPTVGFMTDPGPGDRRRVACPISERTTPPFRLRAEPGKLLLVFFGYSNCPDICPGTMSNVKFALAGSANGPPTSTWRW